VVRDTRRGRPRHGVGSGFRDWIVELARQGRYLRDIY
jgi:hypothetical protein